MTHNTTGEVKIIQEKGVWILCKKKFQEDTCYVMYLSCDTCDVMYLSWHMYMYV